MLEQFYHLAHAFMNLDLVALSDPKLSTMLCFMLALFMILENGFLPTAFLPGDSLLVLTGVLIYQDVVSWAVLPMLIACSFFGTWLGYMQGRFFGHTELYHRLLSHIDKAHQEKAYYLLNKYGILTLITARYIAFVRTVYPCIVGAAEIPQGRFLIINLISAMMWCTPLVFFGYYISHTKLAETYQNQFLSFILYLPLVLLALGLGAIIWRQIRKRRVASRNK